jgi:hypothetical protein
MNHYNFQLVMQLPDDCRLTSMDFEDDIAAALDNPLGAETAPHKVDGNSIGSGTIEFFVHTNKPVEAFELCKPLLKSAGLLDMIVVAHRKFTEENYYVIWPPGYRGQFSV